MADGRFEAIKRATREEIDAGKNLTLDKKPELSALSDQVGFKVDSRERDRAYKDVAKDRAPVPKPRPEQGAKPAGYDGLQLESAVQIAAKCMRTRQHIEGDGRPSHLRLTALVGFPVTREARDWACAEAYCRSESLEHAEIVAQSLMDKPTVQYEQARGPGNVQYEAKPA